MVEQKKIEIGSEGRGFDVSGSTTRPRSSRSDLAEVSAERARGKEQVARNAQPTDALQETTPATRHPPPAPLWPTETEIYILPDGRIVIADLPVELSAAIAELGVAETEP